MLAPVAPPCFSSRDQWIEYLTHAAEYQRPGHPGPLLIQEGSPALFNYEFGFCHDCTATHRRDMVARERCRPSYLLRVQAQQQALVQSAPAEAEPAV